MDVYGKNEFVISSGFEPVELDDALCAREVRGEYKIWVGDDLYFSFVGGRCELKLYKKDICEVEDFTCRWQKYLINHTPLSKKEEVRSKFRAENEANFYTELLSMRDNCNNDDYSMHLGNAEGWLEIILDQEESRFSEKLNNLSGSESGELVKWVQDKRAEMGSRLHNIITSFLEDNVERSCNEKGEEVYNFTPSQLEIYDAFVEMSKTIDFAYRYELYRIDVKEQENNLQ